MSRLPPGPVPGFQCERTAGPRVPGRSTASEPGAGLRAGLRPCVVRPALPAQVDRRLRACSSREALQRKAESIFVIPRWSCLPADGLSGRTKVSPGLHSGPDNPSMSVTPWSRPAV